MLAESIIGNKSYFRPAEQALIRTPRGSADPNPAIQGVISWFENGERKDLIVPKLWAEAVNFVQPVDVAIGFKVLNRTRSILQAMATGLNLAFASRNVPRDLGDTALLVGPYLRQPKPGGRAIGPATTLFSRDQTFETNREK